MEMEIDTGTLCITPFQQRQIHENHHLKKWGPKELDIHETFRFFSQRYIRPVQQLFEISNCTLVDCAAGYGWLSIAYVLSGGMSAIAVDLDPWKLAAAESIANIMGVGDKITFISDYLHRIPLDDDSVDIFASIETLEHVGKEYIRPSCELIARVTSKCVLVTTPNKLFPIISHDTSLPFIHWLPAKRRRLTATLCRRPHRNKENEFVTPMDLKPILKKIKPVSSCLTYRSYSDYRSSFPYYLPYGSGSDNNRWKIRPSLSKSAYYKTTSFLLGTYSFYAMPSLTAIFTRR